MPLVPLAGAALNGITGLRRSERGVGAIAIATVGAAFLLALRAFFTYPGTPVVETHFTWIAAGDFKADFTYYYDALTAIMTLVVTGVGLLIHIYATGYMSGDKGFYRFLDRKSTRLNSSH